MEQSRCILHGIFNFHGFMFLIWIIIPVVTVERVTDALAMILERKDEVDLVMTELHMPDMDGLQLLDEIQKTSKLPVVSEY